MNHRILRRLQSIDIHHTTCESKVRRMAGYSVNPDLHLVSPCDMKLKRAGVCWWAFLIRVILFLHLN